MDRILTKVLLAHSNIESTTPENSDNDCFSRWPTPEVCGACAAPTDCGLPTREVVEATRSVTCRQRYNAVGTTNLSYNELRAGGCFNRTTFEYVPNNGAYLAFKTAVRVDDGMRRQQRGRLGRCGMTKWTKVVDGDGDGAVCRHVSCDDRQTARRRVDALQQPRNDRTNQTWCNDGRDVMTQRQISVDLQPRNENHHKDTEATLSRGRHSSEATATCSGDVDSTDEIKSTQRSDSRQLKTWLYSFLPPIVTRHGDADSPRENLAEVRDHCLLPTKSRTVSSRSHDQCPRDERHPIIAGARLDEPGTRRRQQRQLKSAASDDVTHSHGQCGRQTVERDQRRRWLSSDSATDDYQVYFTEACLLPQCACSYHHQVYSDHDDETTLTSRIGEQDDNDKTSDGGVDDDAAAAAAAAAEDGDDEEEEEETEKEATKSTLKSFDSRLNKLKMKQCSEQLQLSLTGHVIDIHSRNEQSRKS